MRNKTGIDLYYLNSMGFNKNNDGSYFYYTQEMAEDVIKEKLFFAEYLGVNNYSPVEKEIIIEPNPFNL